MAFALREVTNEILSARPDANVKMIPVGPILAKLLTDTDLANIPIDVLYEDDAPHGRPTLYFLASLVTYMGTFGVPAPVEFEIPPTVSSIVADNYAEVITFIWGELQTFEDAEGNSRIY